MKTNNIFKWPKEIYIFWLVDFILGLELIGPALLIFFKEWGGLNQTQTQILQSWFTLWIFILEIPTGVYGDVKGKKHSVMLGHTLAALGTIVYSIVPNIKLFFLAEFIFALGVAFISGAKEAWIYDIAKKHRIEGKFREITATSTNLHMLGMIIASGAFAFLVNLIPIQHIFRMRVICSTISVILLGFFVKSTDGKKKSTLKPDYIGTAKKGFNILRSNLNLKKITIYISILSSTSYFVIWLYQEALKVLEVPETLFGAYRIILLVGEILAIRIIAYLLKKYDNKKVNIGMAIIVASGFIIGALLRNTVGIFFVLAFAGGLGLQVSNIFSKETNEEISSEQRATVLSFISMVKRLMLTIFNPFIGYIVDSKGVFIAFAILGVISLSAVFFKPKVKLK